MNTHGIACFMLIAIGSVFTHPHPFRECAGNTGISWRAESTDCSTFYICNGESVSKRSCPVNTVTNSHLRACVPKGSKLDTCSQSSETLSTLSKMSVTQATSAYDVCRLSPEGVVLFPNSCARFINCSHGSGIKMEECSYPLLFDETTRVCTLPTEARCGSRYVPLDPCEYQKNQCQVAGCVPCHHRLPSCKNMEDGFNAWRGKETSPFFVICLNQRVVYHGRCPVDGTQTIFNPIRKICVKNTEIY